MDTPTLTTSRPLALRMGHGRALTLAWCALGALLLALIGSSALTVQRLNAHASWLDHTGEVQLQIEQLRSAMSRAGRTALELRTAEPQPDNVLFEAQWLDAVTTARELAALVADNPEQTAGVTALLAELEPQRLRLRALMDADPPQLGPRLAEAQAGREALRAQLDTLATREDGLRIERAARVRKAERELAWVQSATAVLALAMLVATGLLWRRESGRRDAAEQALDEVNNRLERDVQQRTAELAAAVGRLEALVDGVPVALALFDAEGRLRQANRPLEALAERTAPTEPAQGLDAVGAGLSFLAAPVREVLDGHQRVVETVTHAGRRLLLSAVALDDGHSRGAALVVSDITALDQARERSEQLSRRLLQVQEEERRALALELHDDLGQRLAALKMNLGMMARAPAPLPVRLREDSVHIVEGCIDQVRQRVAALRPPLLDDLGVGPALEAHAATQRLRSGRQIDVQVDAALAALDGAWAIHVFRIVQEAQRNALLHGNARHVQVRLASAHDEVLLQIQDDGCGLPAELPTGGTGLSGMRERVELTGGRFRIGLARGPAAHGNDTVTPGCRIECRWPRAALARETAAGGAAHAGASLPTSAQAAGELT